LKNLMITGGLLQAVAFGAGRFSIDARWDRVGSVALGARAPHAVA